MAERFAGDGQHLARYARVFNAVEINSSFYRPHKVETYARWAAMTPDGFRFAVKVPKSITHLQRLKDADTLLERFLEEARGLGSRLGPLLLQLPPSLALDVQLAATFFEALRRRHAGAVVCEPRHLSWFTPQAQALLMEHRIGRVAADPAPCPEAAVVGGWLGSLPDGQPGVAYVRLHGTPRKYWSAYTPQALASWTAHLQQHSQADRWCIFDNTAGGAAIEDALDFQRLRP